MTDAAQSSHRDAAAVATGDAAGLPSLPVVRVMEKLQADGEMKNITQDAKTLAKEKSLPRGVVLPKLHNSIKSKFDVARQNGIIASHMGTAHPGLNGLLQAEKAAKQKVRQRVAELNQIQAAQAQAQEAAATASGAVTGTRGGVAGPGPGTEAARLAAQQQLAARQERRKAHNAPWRRKLAQGGSADEGPAIRPTSRVGKVLAEFGGKEDWVAQVAIKHAFATIVQANVRGWLVRRRWRRDPVALVSATKAALEAEKQRAARRAAAIAELHAKTLTRKQKDKASNVLTTLFKGKSKGPAGGGAGGGGAEGGAAALLASHGSKMGTSKWGRVAKNIDIVSSVVSDPGPLGMSLLEESDSDFSDLDVEDVALVKLRAKTPPWQKVEQSHWVGQWAKLKSRPARGNLDVIWDLDASLDRIYAVKARRKEAVVGGNNCNGGGSDPDGSSMPPLLGDGSGDVYSIEEPLPPQLINSLLMDRYSAKFARLGLPEQNPLRNFVPPPGLPRA